MNWEYAVRTTEKDGKKFLSKQYKNLEEATKRAEHEKNYPWSKIEVLRREIGEWEAIGEWEVSK